MDAKHWLLGVAAAVGVIACAPESSSADRGLDVAARRPSVAASRAARTVTLVTGDQVTIEPTGELPSVTVQRGPGRERVVFLTHLVGKRIQVIPHDMVPLITAGRLTLSDFEVTPLSAEPAALTAAAAAAHAESFTVTARALDLQGKPALLRLFALPIEPGAVSEPRLVDVEGEVSFSLPRGLYTLESFGNAPDFVDMIYPRFEVAGDTTVVLDRRLARPIAIEVEGVPLEVIDGAWMYSDVAHDVAFSISDSINVATAQLGPEAAPGEVVSWLQATLVRDAAEPSPRVVYEVGHAERDHYLTGWSAALAPEQLATVHEYHAGQDRVTYGKSVRPVFQDTLGLRNIRRSAPQLYVGPFERTVHYFGPEFLWGERLDTFAPPDARGRISSVLSLDQLPIARRAGYSVEHWNRAPLGPAFPVHPAGIPNRSDGLDGQAPSAVRSGDALTVEPSPLTDAPVLDGCVWHESHVGVSRSIDQRIAVFRDGVLIEQLVNVPLQFAVAVPPEPGIYRLEQEISRRDSDIVELSRHLSTVWTFPSQHAPGGAPETLPLPTVRFAPELDSHSRAPRVHALPAVVARPPGAATPRITGVTVEASFDDGVTWSRLPGGARGERWLGLVIAPRDASFVSLHAAAEDEDGRRVEQTIIRAYGLGAR